jgi:hypothetical protein
MQASLEFTVKVESAAPAGWGARFGTCKGVWAWVSRKRMLLAMGAPVLCAWALGWLRLASPVPG